ncbi:MAG: hypothetical protein ACRDS0_11370 [Pseudonocardiaceae bacterium]
MGAVGVLLGLVLVVFELALVARMVLDWVSGRRSPPVPAGADIDPIGSRSRVSDGTPGSDYRTPGRLITSVRVQENYASRDSWGVLDKGGFHAIVLGRTAQPVGS